MALGEEAFRVPISSSKSMTGHLLGAGGALEAAICIMSMRDGIVPPTINLDEADPECDLDYTPNVAIRRQVDVAMSNSFGFGGHNSVLVFGKPGSATLAVAVTGPAARWLLPPAPDVSGLPRDVSGSRRSRACGPRN